MDLENEMRGLIYHTQPMAELTAAGSSPTTTPKHVLESLQIVALQCLPWHRSLKSFCG
jgi:hypothetical protein